MQQSKHQFASEQELDSLLKQWQWENRDSASSPKKESPFPFNPNVAQAEELQRLGLNKALAQRIVNYRAKGGVFRMKQDLLKIYGMDSALYRHLVPFIQLPEQVQRQDVSDKMPLATNKTIETLDINQADSIQLEQINGIGNTLAQRIIKYRNKLGGFVSLSQLREVYGLDSLVIGRIEKRFIVKSDFKPQQLNINTSAEKDLGTHPYIGYKAAKAIAAYRFQHGAFEQVDDLQNIQLIPREKFIKMKPYLTR